MYIHTYVATTPSLTVFDATQPTRPGGRSRRPFFPSLQLLAHLHRHGHLRCICVCIPHGQRLEAYLTCNSGKSIAFPDESLRTSRAIAPFIGGKLPWPLIRIVHTYMYVKKSKGNKSRLPIRKCDASPGVGAPWLSVSLSLAHTDQARVHVSGQMLAFFSC